MSDVVLEVRMHRDLDLDRTYDLKELKRIRAQLAAALIYRRHHAFWSWSETPSSLHLV